MSSQVASTVKAVEDVPDMSWKQAVTWDFGDDGATQLLPPTTILFCSFMSSQVKVFEDVPNMSQKQLPETLAFGDGGTTHTAVASHILNLLPDGQSG